MTSISYYVYIDKLDDIVDRYNNRYHIKIKMKPIDAKPSIYIDLNKEEVFVITKVENNVPWTYIISDLKGEDIVGRLYERELQKSNQKELRLEK